MSFFHTSRAKRIFSFAEHVLSPRAPDATWPKCNAQLGWRREFHFLAIQLNTFWPDFGEEDVDDALAEYAQTQRTFGLVPETMISSTEAR